MELYDNAWAIYVTLTINLIFFGEEWETKMTWLSFLKVKFLIFLIQENIKKKRLVHSFTSNNISFYFIKNKFSYGIEKNKMISHSLQRYPYTVNSF